MSGAPQAAVDRMPPPGPATDAMRPIVMGLVTIALCLGGVGAWSVTAEIAGAVVAGGAVRTETRRVVLQHPDGGAVAEISVRDGDRVAAGDRLLSFDDTFLRSELAILEGQLAEIFARETLFTAERDDVEFPDDRVSPEFETLGPDELRDRIGAQRSLFRIRRAAHDREARQLSLQQVQIERQIDGTRAELAALGRQLALIEGERADVQSLFDQRLVPAARLLALRREEARIAGETGRLTSLDAELELRKSAIALELATHSDRRREEAIARLMDLGYTTIELEEKRHGVIERLARLDLRATASGTVIGSRVAAPGTVIGPGEPILSIVSDDLPVEIAARIEPRSIDRIFPGQDAMLVFPAFDRSTTPEISGTVLRVSPDTVADEAGRPFYEAVIRPDPQALAALPDVKLLPGMPVEAFLRTGQRSPLSYLTRPITVYVQRALRED